MNPQLYQSIRLMELPVMDLREKIAAEVERNPALEIIKENNTATLGEDYFSQKIENNYKNNYSDTPYINRKSGSDEKHKFIEGVLTQPETLQEHLLRQIRLEKIDEETRRIAETLIQNLDNNGFHKEPPSLLLPNENADRIEKALQVVQALDPTGTGTTDYKESLKVQARLLPSAPNGIIEAFDYLEELERGKYTYVAKQLGITSRETERIFERIKELSPFPGRRFGESATRYVIPDIEVIRKEGRFVIRLNNEEIPVLGIHPFFMEIAGKKGGNKEEKDFVRENVKEARWFINSINLRNHTLLKVSRAILEFQRQFFLKGPKYLAPLNLRDIAAAIGVHETTVSRASNGKYMQTEWGVFEIRYFFSNSVSSTDAEGVRYSKEGVKEILKELLSGEARHFSDNEIVGLLAKKGISLARRTVAKYRSELELGSSYTR